MLIRISVENFKSFKDKTEFNMLTGEIRRHSHHVYKTKKLNILKSAAIYGANGAGKSNLIKAIDLLTNIVLNGNIDAYYNSQKFRMNQEYSSIPTTIEVEFIEKGIGYAYGIELNENNILSEWLYTLGYDQKNDELVFERHIQKNNKAKITLNSKYLKTSKNKVLLEVYQDDLLKSNIPFINLAKEKFKDITNAFNWFHTGVLIIYPHMRFAGLPDLFTVDSKFKDFANSLIEGFQTGINHLEIDTIPFDLYFGEDDKETKDRIIKQLNQTPEELIGLEYNAMATIENNKPVVKKVFAYHIDDKKNKIKFELEEESDGTQRLLDFLPALYLLWKKPVSILIDEIDQSIHSALLKEFLFKLQGDKTTKGQIIFTTHESNLLDLDLFRQDEIWFAEKNKHGATEFYPLSDYDIRPELDIRKGYLSGRFGAIPFLANLKDLNWKYEKK